MDIVVCEFGNHHGFLSWYEDAGDGSYRRHVLDARPGAASAAVRDLDGDGLQDVVALMAQGDEGVDVYLNQGDGQFRQKRVLRFPPAYGSNHIELADFDDDGILDILLGSNIGFGPRGDRTGLYERWVEESPSIVILENE